MQSKQRILNTEAQATPKHASAMWMIPGQFPTPPVGIIETNQLLPSIFESQKTPEPCMHAKQAKYNKPTSPGNE